MSAQNAATILKPFVPNPHYSPVVIIPLLSSNFSILTLYLPLFPLFELGRKWVCTHDHLNIKLEKRKEKHSYRFWYSMIRPLFDVSVESLPQPDV